MPLVARVLSRALPPLAVLALAGALPDAAWAGGWMRAEGELRLAMSLSLSTAEERWDKDRRLRDAACTKRRGAVGVQGEYGYSYYYTVFADASVSHKECAGESDASGLSDLSIGVRGRLDPFRNGRTWEVSLKLPVSGGTDDPDRSGNGEFGLQAGVHFRVRPDPYAVSDERRQDGGWSWGTGVRLWTGGLPPQGWGYAEWQPEAALAGWRTGARLYGLRSFGGDGAGSSRRSRGNDYDRLTASLGASRKLDADRTVSVELAHDLWGRNADRESQLRLGLSRMWR